MLLKPSPLSCGLNVSCGPNFANLCTLRIPFKTLCFHSEYLLMVAFLWTGAISCSFSSACLYCLCVETVWCHDLLCVNCRTFLCFSVWRVCSFFFSKSELVIFIWLFCSSCSCVFLYLLKSGQKKAFSASDRKEFSVCLFQDFMLDDVNYGACYFQITLMLLFFFKGLTTVSNTGCCHSIGQNLISFRDLLKDHFEIIFLARVSWLWKNPDKQITKTKRKLKNPNQKASPQN